MTITEALKLANFLSSLAMDIYRAADNTPAGGSVNLDHLFVLSTTQKLRDAGIDAEEADRLGKKDT